METRTSGSEGGPGNQAVRKGDTAPRPDPYKAGPAGGRLRRPSSAGKAVASDATTTYVDHA